MKLLAQVIEQIEEATIQLDKQTVTGSRLALILIDNVIEILMYNLTSDELSFEDQKAIIDGTFRDKYPEFKNKTQFLLSYEIISNDQKVIMDICHKFRNEAYHANKLRDRIINQIAKVYFNICCEIIPELISEGRSLENGQDTFVAKYGISIYYISSFGTNIFSAEKFKELIKIFSAGREYNEEELSKILALDIEERVIYVKKNLKEIQEIDTQNSYTDFEERLELIFSRIAKLKAIRNTSKAIQKYYYNCDKDLLKIELNVDLISAILDNIIDLAVDQQRERDAFGND